MSDFINLEKNFTLQVGDPKDFEMICKVGKALATPSACSSCAASSGIRNIFPTSRGN